MGFKSSNDIRSLWVYANNGSFSWRDPRTNAICESDCFEGVITGVEFEESFFEQNGQKEKTGTNINLHVTDIDPNGIDRPILIKGSLERDSRKGPSITVYGRMMLGRLGNLSNNLDAGEVLLLSVWNTTSYKICCFAVSRSVHPDKKLESYPLDPKDDPTAFRAGIRECIKNLLQTYPLKGDLSALESSGYDFGDIGYFLETAIDATGSLAHELRTGVPVLDATYRNQQVRQPDIRQPDHQPASTKPQQRESGSAGSPARTANDHAAHSDEDAPPWMGLYGDQKRVQRHVGPDDDPSVGDGLPF